MTKSGRITWTWTGDAEIHSAVKTGRQVTEKVERLLRQRTDLISIEPVTEQAA